MERRTGTLFLLLIVIVTVNAIKLNYPRVLLPIFDKISVNFTLEVIEKGCFKWSASRQDLILITPQPEDADSECTRRAIVTVLTRERRRNTAFVMVEDTQTSESLRCDVILDVIDKLGVHTTTRQLYLEEAPETFELRAEDSQGNEFSTLEGIEFNWIISSLNRNNKGLTPALRFLTFTESPYHVVPSALVTFEAQHLKGYMVLLEGINTGTAKVTVSLPYPEYNHVPKIEVFINVLANIILEPNEANIIVGDVIDFRVLQLKMGKLEEISLGKQYFLEIVDDQVASIRHISVTALKKGRTMVLLRDRNAPPDSATDSVTADISIPSAQLKVVSPMKLGLNLLPYNNWITVEGEKNAIAFDLYTSDDQKITLGSRYSIPSEVDQDLFKVLDANSNGTRLFGQAVREGVTTIRGSFEELTAQADLQIYPALKLSPKRVILPFDPNVVKLQKVQFLAEGGDSSYIWQSLNTRLMQINQNGLASTIIRDSESGKRSYELYEGNSLLTVHASIRVALSRNQKITRQAEIYFLPPAHLEIVRYNFETALRDYVQLHIAVYAYMNDTFVPYTRCDNLPIELEFSNQIFQLDNAIEKEEMHVDACQVIYLRSTALGMTHLTVSYKFQDKLLKDEVTLSVFEPLNILNPIENEVVLPIGASRNVIYSNGPQRIFTLEAELTKSTDYDQQIVEVNEIILESENELHSYRILCRKVGKTTFSFNVYNSLAAKGFQAYFSTVTTTVFCVKPRFLNLYATEKLRPGCPLELKHSLLHLKEHEDKFEIEIEIQDVKNRKLMNISSLIIDWEFTAGDKHYQSEQITHQRQSELELYKSISLPSRDILVTTFANVPPNLRIKGLVSGYDNSVLKKHGITAERPPFGIKNPKTGEVIKPIIENEIRFLTVNSTLFASDHVSVFLSKNRRERLRIAQGSGYYDLELSESGIVNVEYETKTRELVITPLRIGHTRLELIDRCLINEPAHLSISVVGIGAIAVAATDYSVERTKSIEAIVRLYDSNENLLQIDTENLQIYGLSENVFNNDILTLKLAEQNDLKVGEIRYILTGNNLGDTKIVFNSESGDSMVSSEPVNVQVFSPLRLYPRNSTLVVGSSVQIYYQGGPQPDVNIVYHVHDKKLISMESAIVTAYKLGSTKITGKCVMTNAGNGKTTTISEDTVEVHVVPLQNIKIKTPLVRIRSGAVMPAAVWGVPDLSPMVLGTLANMRVTWSTNQRDVVDIYNIFADAGIEYTESDLISVRIKALNPGKAKIQATIELSSGQKLQSSVEVVVFKILELDSPKRITMDWILMAPRTSIHLKANLDDVIYKPDSDSSGIVTVLTDGLVRSRDTLGRDLIIAKSYEQTLPIGIEVKNVQYILASLVYPSLKLKQIEEKIPRGMNFMLKVSLHDNLGNEFSHNVEDINDLRYDLSQKDVVDVQIGNNFTLMISLPREASNMIAISLKDTTGVKHAEDYIKLSVAESKHIYPNKTIFSVGDIICFDSPLTMSSIWTSSDEQIVSIDRFTGVAKVLSNRFKLGEKVVVSNGDKASGSYIKYDVEVRDADVFKFDKTFDIFSGIAYRANLQLRNHLQSEKLTNLFARNFSRCADMVEKLSVNFFSCHLSSKQSLGLQLLNHYKVQPIFNTEAGVYACDISLKTNFQDILNLVKNNDIHFVMKAQLANGLTDTTSLQFIPGIRTSTNTLRYEGNKNLELSLTGLERVLQKVEVKPSDEKWLQVSARTKQPGTYKFNIIVNGDLPEDENVFVNIYSPATSQTIEIPIIASDMTVQKCDFLSSPSIVTKTLTYIGIAITGILAIVIAIWLYAAFTVQPINREVFNKTTSTSSGKTSTPISSPERSQSGSFYGNRSYSPESYNNRTLSPGNESPVYGDTSLTSPYRRLHRRFL